MGHCPHTHAQLSYLGKSRLSKELIDLWLSIGSEVESAREQLLSSSLQIPCL
jgi:hypothetical protein